MQCMHRFYPAYTHKISWGEVIKSDTLISSAFITTPSLKPPSVPPAPPSFSPASHPASPNFPPSLPLTPFPSPPPRVAPRFSRRIQNLQIPNGVRPKAPWSVQSSVRGAISPTPHVLGLGLGPMPDSRRALLPGLRPKPRRALQLQQRRSIISSLFFP